MISFVNKLLVLSMMMTFLLVGCNEVLQVKDDLAKKAVEDAKLLKSVGEQVVYLVQKAEEFIKSEQFQAAVDVARYVLENLDRDSQIAKNLLSEATMGLQAKLKSTVEKTQETLRGIVEQPQSKPR